MPNARKFVITSDVGRRLQRAAHRTRPAALLIAEPKWSREEPSSPVARRAAAARRGADRALLAPRGG